MDQMEAFLQQNSKIRKQLSETENVVKILQKEVELCRQIETHMRLQLTRTQERIISLQKEDNLMKTLLTQSNQQRKQISLQDETIKELKKKLNEVEMDVKNKLLKINIEIDLQKKIQELTEQLESQSSNYHLTLMDNQIKIKEKEQTITRLEDKLLNTTSSLQKAQYDYNMVKNEFDRVHLVYNKQLMDQEQTIRRYEKDLKEILGEGMGMMKPKKDDWDKNLHVTWADSARQMYKIKTNESTLINEEPERGPREDAPPNESVKFRPKVKVSRPPVRNSKAAPLDVQAVREDQKSLPKKKKLFTSTSNDYLE